MTFDDPDEIDEDFDEDLDVADPIEGDYSDSECISCGGIIGVDVPAGEETDHGPICSCCMDD